MATNSPQKPFIRGAGKPRYPHRLDCRAIRWAMPMADVVKAGTGGCAASVQAPPDRYSIQLKANDNMSKTREKAPRGEARKLVFEMGEVGGGFFLFSNEGSFDEIMSKGICPESSVIYHREHAERLMNERVKQWLDFHFHAEPSSPASLLRAYPTPPVPQSPPSSTMAPNTKRCSNEQAEPAR